MDIAKKPSPAIIAAAIVAILGSTLLILFSGLAAFGIHKAAEEGTKNLPPLAARAAQLFILMMAAFAIFGICIAAGLLILKNWARIAILIIAGVMVPFAALAIIFVVVALPNTAGVPPGAMANIRVAVAVFYSIPIAVGIWWLILFTRKPVIVQFEALSWSPEIAGKLPDEIPASILNPHPGPKCPIAIVVIAWIGIITAAGLVFSAILHSPTIVFGKLLTGPGATALHLGYCLAYLLCGIGLLRLFVPSFWAFVALQLFTLAAGIVNLLTPNLEELIRKLLAISPRFGMPAPEYGDALFRQMRFSMGGTLVIPILYLVFLFVYRSRFMRAAAEKAAAVQPAEIALQ